MSDTSRAAREDAGALSPHDVDVLGHVHAFAAGCFVVFGALYQILLGSRYLLLSNLAFGALCVLSWFAWRPLGKRHVQAFALLSIVYVGLVNVVVHIGVHDGPMIYWGMSVPIAAAFLFRLRGILFWMLMGFVFLPICFVLKRTWLAGRVIPVGALQNEILIGASYSGILLFLAFIVFLFNRKLSISVAEREATRAEAESILRVVCHDFATPLAVLHLRIARLQTVLSTEAVAQAVRSVGKPEAFVDSEFAKVQATMEMIERLLEDVKRFALASSGKSDQQTERVHVTDALREAVLLLEQDARDKGVEIRIAEEVERAPAVLFPREGLVHQVFVNVLSNAIKFSPDDSVVEARVTSDETELAVSVRDHGIGIPDEILGRIFSASAHTSRPGTRGECGSGFGMPIVKAVLDRHDATISIRSRVAAAGEDDAGTEVTLRFPRV